MFKQALLLWTHKKAGTAFMIVLLALVFFLLGSVPALFAQRDDVWFQE